MSTLTELSKATLASYINKATNKGLEQAHLAGKLEKTKEKSKDNQNQYDDALSLARKRVKGVKKAANKLAKDNVEDEMSSFVKSNFASKVKPKFKMKDGKMVAEGLTGKGKLDDIEKHYAEKQQKDYPERKYSSELKGFRAHLLKSLAKAGDKDKDRIKINLKLTKGKIKDRLNEEEKKKTKKLDTDAINDMIHRSLEKKLGRYIEGKVVSGLVTKHMVMTRVNKDKTDKKASSELKKLFTEEAPTNAMGSSSSTAGTGPIDTFDPLLFHKKRKDKVVSIMAKRRKQQGL